MIKRDLFGKRIYPLYIKQLVLVLTLLVIGAYSANYLISNRTIERLENEQIQLENQLEILKNQEIDIVEFLTNSLEYQIPEQLDNYEIGKELDFAKDMAGLTAVNNYRVLINEFASINSYDEILPDSITYVIITVDFTTTNPELIDDYIRNIEETNQLFIIESLNISHNENFTEFNMQLSAFYKK